MEPVFQAHPIPQNVTNFEFHLVGDMTLKQFAYLAAGVGFAFLIFTTLSTVQPIIAWPIIVISSLLGVAFAFLPIQERPLDHWVAAFFKAIFKPTFLKFSSKIINSDDPLFNRRLSHYLKTYKYVETRQHAVLGNPNLLPTALSSSAPAPKPVPQTQASAQKKQNFIDKFKAGQTSFVPLATSGPQQLPPQAAPPLKTAPVPNIAVQPKPLPDFPKISASTMPGGIPPAALPPIQRPAAPTPLPDLNITVNAAHSPAPKAAEKPPAPKPEVTDTRDLKKTVELAEEAQKTQQEIVEIEKELAKIKQQAAQPGANPKIYLEEFQELLNHLQKLNERASHTAKEMAEISNEPAKPVVPETITVKAKSIPTLKLTSFPNVLSGIVTDSLGNYIEGAIVVAHDKQGLPVRALKSNKLGQFVAATPLPNGEYSISVEKDDLIFDRVAIIFNNEVLPPILVAAKKLVAT